DLRYTFHQYHLLIPPRYSARMLTWQEGQFYSLITHPSGSILHADSEAKRAWRYALAATRWSALGGTAGWWIGSFAFDAIAIPILEFWGKLDTFNELKAGITFETILLMLVTSGLAHLPPIKVVTILSGAVNVNIWLFIVSALVTRGARFF